MNYNKAELCKDCSKPVKKIGRLPDFKKLKSLADKMNYDVKDVKHTIRKKDIVNSREVIIRLQMSANMMRSMIDRGLA